MRYSLDLRQRVVKFVKDGGSKAEAARRFGVSPWCVFDWVKRDDLQPNKPGPKNPHKINLLALQQDVADHADAYLSERAERLGVGKSTIGRWLGTVNK